MESSRQEQKMRQSSMITRVGCFGAVLVIVLLVLIGFLAARADLARKRLDALGDLARVREQIEKSPDILNRMLALGCAEPARAQVAEIKSGVESLGTATIIDLDAIWVKVESAYLTISTDCGGTDAPRLGDVRIEFEGVRNRRSVERAKYVEAAQVFNDALAQFPNNLLPESMRPFEMKPLSLGENEE